MKLTNLTKSILAASALTVASFGANAGVVATSFIELKEVSVLVDGDNDGVFDQNPLDFITILGGSRLGTTDASFDNGVAPVGGSDGTGNVGAVAVADADFLCFGPDCDAGMTSNAASHTSGAENLVNDHTKSYSMGDMFISGNALAAGASGFTYADSAISEGFDSEANANANIANSVFSAISFAVVSTIDVKLAATFDAFVDAFISADIAADPLRGATATSTGEFTISLTNSSGTVFSDVRSYTKNAHDIPGLNDPAAIDLQDEAYTSGTYALTAGSYVLEINQESDTIVTLVPEPTSLAVLGLGLLGFAGAARRRKS